MITDKQLKYTDTSILNNITCWVKKYTKQVKSENNANKRSKFNNNGMGYQCLISNKEYMSYTYANTLLPPLLNVPKKEFSL